MKKTFFFIIIYSFLILSCSSNKKFIEDADKLHKTSENFSEIGNETPILAQPFVLYMINNKIVSKEVFAVIDKEQIKMVTVIKDKKEIAKYAKGDYEGLIIVTLK